MRPSYHAAADGQPAGEQPRTAWRTDARRRVKTGPLLAFVCHAIQVGSLDRGVSEDADVAVANIVAENNNHVRRAVLGH